MEGKARALTLTKLIRVNGVPAEASLVADGTLRWRAGDGDETCLAVESEILGFEAEGQRITLRTFVGSNRGVSYGGGSFGKKTRRDHVLELPSEEATLQWSQRLRDCIESLGKTQGLLFLFIYLFFLDQKKEILFVLIFCFFVPFFPDRYLNL